MGGALGVVITTDVPVEGRAAVPVYVDDSLPIVGPSRAVVVVPADGRARLAGGPPMAVRLAPAGTPATGPAIPVYVVSGSLDSFVDPSSLSGLIGWYQATSLSGLADGAAVSSWADLSTAGNTLTQGTGANQPTKQTNSGAPVVRNAANKYLANTSLAVSSRAFTLFGVISGSSIASAQKIMGVGGSNRVLLNQFSSDWGAQSTITSGSTFNDLWLTGLRPTQNVFYTVCIRSDSDGAITIFMGGQEVYRMQGHGADAVTAATLTGLYVGTSGELVNHFTGDFKEVVLYNRALTDDEARQVAAYLSAQHGLTPVSSGKQVVFDGNSLTVGYVAFPGMTDVAIAGITGGLWRASNFGVSGQTIEQMASDAATQIDPLYRSGFSKNILVCWEGTNALQTLQNPTTVYNDIVSYCQARQAAGWKVVIVTVPPRTAAGVYANFETDRQTLNTNINTNYATFADARADVGGDATIGGATAPNNTTYYSDKTHLTSAGYAIAANIIKTAINAL